jgi:hypothetical protein
MQVIRRTPKKAIGYGPSRLRGATRIRRRRLDASFDAAGLHLVDDRMPFLEVSRKHTLPGHLSLACRRVDAAATATVMSMTVVPVARGGVGRRRSRTLV